MADPGLGQHLMANCTAGSENQAQADNLVEKWVPFPSPNLGNGSTPAPLRPHIDSLEDASTALWNHPQPVDRGHGRQRLAGFTDDSAPACLLASPGGAPKPRDPATYYNHYLIYYYIKGEK